MGTLRITSGRLRGRTVDTPEGVETRPLLTRLRKSLADILRPRLPGASILDLFGGSGAIAFELLSNGAARALVVELSSKASDLIRRNAAALGEADRVEVRAGDGLEVARALAERGETFDVVVVAPPYGRDLHRSALHVLDDHPLLTSGGIVVVQREAREPVATASECLVHVRTRRYGRTAFDFYEGRGS